MIKYISSKSQIEEKQGRFGTEIIFECPSCKKMKCSWNVGKEVFQCFRCGLTGNARTLKKLYGDVDYYEKPDRTEPVQRIWQEASQYFEMCLSKNPTAKEFWKKRGIKFETLMKFKVGLWDKGLSNFLKGKNFLTGDLIESGLLNSSLQDSYSDVYTLPYISKGFIQTFKFRPTQKANIKSWSLKGRSLTLYGEDFINQKEVVICEGEPDTMILNQAGISAVGIPGALSFKEDFVDKVGEVDTIYVCLDSDEAGQNGVNRIVKTLSREIYNVSLPDKCDVNDYFLSFPSQDDGFIAFREQQRRAVPYSKGIIEEQSIDSLIPPSGFIRSYIDYASALTDAPKRFHYMSALSIISALLRNKMRIEFGSFTLKPNIYSVVLAGSTQFRKSTAQRIAKNILYDFEEEEENVESDANILYPSEFTRESLYDILGQRSCGIFFINEMGHFLAQCNRKYNEGMKEFFTDIYDSPKRLIRNLRKSSVVIKEPCVSVIGASTIDWFVNQITESDLTGGFLYRFLYMPARKIERFDPLPQLEDKMQTKIIKNKANHINSLLPGELKFSEDAISFYRDWSIDFNRRKKDKVLEPFVGRYSMYAIKIAILYAVQDVTRNEFNYYIDKKSIQYGINAVEFFFSEMKRLFDEEISFSRFEREHKKVLKVIRDANSKGVSKTTLLRRTQRLKGREREEILNYLLGSNSIYIDEVQTKGRRKSVYKIR